MIELNQLEKYIISKKDKIIAGEYLTKKYDTTYLHKKK